MSKLWRLPLSQNFLWNRGLVNQLVRSSSITSDDLVLEVGPGRGIITEQLLKSAKGVIAVELDDQLFASLRLRFGKHPRVSLIHQDFLSLPLPAPPYKVFSSIPFNITGQIIRKLLQSGNPPSDCYLIVQFEAALKFVPNNERNTLAAFLYYPWWEMRVIHQFRRTDFSPAPNVDCVLLRMTQRAGPLLDLRRKSVYQDYCAYSFGRNNEDKYLSAPQFLENYLGFVRFSEPRRLAAIRGAFTKLQNEQEQLSKIHRTRTDPKWKSFRPK
jgi:23S rRNA (adenine-N6)-dimethyltransferase